MEGPLLPDESNTTVSHMKQEFSSNPAENVRIVSEWRIGKDFEEN
jgi:hypothetical protein